MSFMPDTGWRKETREILEGCVSRIPNSCATVLVRRERGTFHVPVNVGFRPGESPFTLLGTDSTPSLWKALVEAQQSGAPGVLAAPVRARRRVLAMAGFFRLEGRLFDDAQAADVRAASRLMGRNLETHLELLGLQQSYLKTIMVLLQTIEAKDNLSRGHSARVAEYCRRCGQAVGLSAPDMETLRWAALLHDIGKIGIVDAILQKRGRLTPEEMVIVREHPVIGQRIVQDLKTLRKSSFLIRWHHERWDGMGYPDGLAAEDIPLPARILALAEAFDTITNRTAYSLGRSREEATRILRRQRGNQFDPGLVAPFLDSLS